MSLHATRAAWRVRVPNGPLVSGRTAHHVLLAMADTCRRNNDHVRVSHGELARLTGYGLRTVERAMAHLRARHLIYVANAPTPRRSARYRFGPWFHALPTPETRPAMVTGQTRHGDELRAATAAGIPGFRDLPRLDEPRELTARERKAVAKRTAALRGSVSGAPSARKPSRVSPTRVTGRRAAAAGGGV